jgi:elongator complex protein 4
LDDLLGGGLPLSCSLVVAAPDIHSAYGELVQKYFISQGLASGHRLLLIDDRAEKFARQCMWTTTTTTATPTSTTISDKNTNGTATLSKSLEGEEDDEEDGNTTGAAQEKIKIAWRYEEMKQFQTTVTSSSYVCTIIFLLYFFPSSFLCKSIDYPNDHIQDAYMNGFCLLFLS